MAAILELENITMEFNSFKAVDNVSMDFEEAKIRVIIGPNGAGKTTLMDMITGKTRPSAGKIRFRGEDITGKPAHEIANKYGIGRKFQGPNLFENMIVEENIEVALKGYTGIWRSLAYRRTPEIQERIDSILERTHLADQRNLYASTLSHGQRQWLEIGMVIAQNPQLVILDEPTAGMTATETYKTGELIKELLVNHAVIVAEHDMDFVRQVAAKVTVLHQGRILAEGTFEEVEQNPEVARVYLRGQ